MITLTSGTCSFQAFLGRSRNRLGLAAFFGALARIRAGRVDKRDDRHREPVGKIHQPDRLAVPFRSRHAEVALDPGFRVRPFLVSDDHHRTVIEPCQPAHDRLVVRKVPVSGKRRIFGEQRFDIVLAMRPVGMARNLALPPGVQAFVQLGQHVGRFLVKRGRFHFYIHLLVGARQSAQFFRLALDFGKRSFKLEIVGHRPIFLVLTVICPPA